MNYTINQMRGLELVRNQAGKACACIEEETHTEAHGLLGAVILACFGLLFGFVVFA